MEAVGGDHRGTVLASGNKKVNLPLSQLLWVMNVSEPRLLVTARSVRVCVFARACAAVEGRKENVSVLTEPRFVW